MKTDKLHFIDYLSVGLLVSLLFFTIFSSNYLNEKKIMSIKACDDCGVGDDLGGGGDPNGSPDQFQGDPGTYTGPDYRELDAQEQERAEAVLREQQQGLDERRESQDVRENNGGTGDTIIPGQSGRNPASTNGGTGNPADTTYYKDANGNWVRTSTTGAGEGRSTSGTADPAGLNSAPRPGETIYDGNKTYTVNDRNQLVENGTGKVYNMDKDGNIVPVGSSGSTGGNMGSAVNSAPRAANGSQSQNSFGNQLLNSLAQSLMRNALSPSRSSSTGMTTSSTGTTSNSTGTTSTSTGTTSTTSSNITPTPGTGISNAAAPAESLNAAGGTTITFNMSLNFQGITKKPADSLNKMKVKVILVDPRATISKRSAMAYGDFVANNSGIWTGSVTFTNVLLGDGYYLLVKGPKHLQKRICSLDGGIVDTSGSGCSGSFAIDQASMTVDFSKNPLAVGDLPAQDGAVNVRDLGNLKSAFGKGDWNSLNSFDLNLDGFINSLDYSLVIQTLLRNGDDQT